MSAVPTTPLNDGNTIPQLGFGAFQIDPGETAAAVAEALRVGYRHIDTAEMYGNEEGVGEAIRASGLDRSELYVTSKLNNGYHEPDDARRAFEGTLDALGFEYVDLFLIHWPLPTLYDGDYVSTWKTLEEFKAGGRARSIGVSNFEVAHLERLEAEADVVPAVNQIELHPYLQNREVDSYDREHGIATQAWSPIAQGAVLDDPVITEIGERPWSHARPGGAALAHRARQHRLSEVHDAGADAGELRAVRLRARGARPRGDRRARPRRGGPHGTAPRLVRVGAQLAQAVSRENVELARRALEAFERGDVEGALASADLERVATRVHPDRAVFHGHDGLLRMVATGSRVSEWSFTIEELIDAGEARVVRQHQRGLGAGSGVPVEDERLVYSFANGRITRFEVHADREQALSSAGLTEQRGGSTAGS